MDDDKEQKMIISKAKNISILMAMTLTLLAYGTSALADNDMSKCKKLKKAKCIKCMKANGAKTTIVAQEMCKPK